jgi:AraC family transcriptional regulator
VRVSAGSITGLVSTEDTGNLLRPVYSSIGLGSHLTFDNYVSSGVVEVPELENPLHVLILRTGSPLTIEWRSSGRDHRAELPPGRVSLFPPGLRQAARVFRHQPGMTSILQIQPRFFDRSIGELARGGKVELIRRSRLNDTQIVRLMESLRAYIAAGSPRGSLFAESVAMALSAHIAQLYSTLATQPERYRGGLSRPKLRE